MSSFSVKGLRVGGNIRSSKFSWTSRQCLSPIPLRRMSSDLKSNVPQQEASINDRPISLPHRSMDEVFMKLAIRNAQNAIRKREVPIGAVLVDSNDTIIATAQNSVETNKDATAHAEIECLRKAAQLLGNWRLQDCTLYTTVEPCIMCFSSIQSFRVKRVVYGARDHRLGACGSLIDLQSAVKHPFHPQIEVTGGVLADESAILLKRFFQNRRLESAEEQRGFVLDEENH